MRDLLSEGVWAVVLGFGGTVAGCVVWHLVMWGCGW